MTELAITDWRVLQLSLEDIGPFRSGIETFSFLGETGPLGTDSDAGPPGPSNLYILIAPNGRGKTTILEAIYGLFALLNQRPEGAFADPVAGGRAQIDLRGTWSIEGTVQTVLLSLWTGSREPLTYWTDEELEAQAQVSHWARLGLVVVAGDVQPLPESNDLGRILFDEVRSALGEAPTEPPSGAQKLPTVLYFPADRSVVAPQDRRVVARPQSWGYQPAHRFTHDGPDWESSIDYLLVWLEWLQDTRLEGLLQNVNEHVFEPESNKRILRPDRAELQTFVSTPTGLHPLSSLSHGERALLQMFARVFSHMTLNTLLLVDEIELHLHTRWMNRMYNSLKQILERNPTLALIFTTHDRELIQVFDYQRQESGLTKGGFLIEDELA